MKNTQLRIIGTDNFNIQQAYKDIRTNLSFISADSKVFSVTSTKEDEGKTTVAINLAKSLSDLRKKTLIIDLDLFNGGMALLTKEDIVNKNIFKLNSDVENGIINEMSNYIIAYKKNIDIL